MIQDTRDMYLFITNTFLFSGSFAGLYHFFSKHFGFSNVNRSISLLHAIVTCVAGFMTIGYFHPKDLYAAPIFVEKIIIDFSFSYFIVDTFYIITVWNQKRLTSIGLRFQWEYFIHHVLCAFLWSFVRFHDVGAPIVMIMLALGELSNPFRIFWELSGELRDKQLRAVFSHLFTWIFISLRCIIGPATGLYMYKTHSPPEEIPAFVVSTIWSSMVFGMLGGFGWSIQLVKGYKKFLQRKMKKTE